MSPFYRCFGDANVTGLGGPHEETRWAWVDGRHCWYCKALGKPAVAYVIESIDAFIRDLDDDLAPPPVDPHHLVLPDRIVS